MDELLTEQLYSIIFHGRAANYSSESGHPFTEQQKKSAITQLLQLKMITQIDSLLVATRLGKKSLGYQ